MRKKYNVPNAWRECHYCGRDMVPFTATHPTKDHVVPRSKGGRSTVMCCYLCNHLKGDQMPEQWAAFMLTNPDWWIGKTVVPPKANNGICPVMVICAEELARERQRSQRLRRVTQPSPRAKKKQIVVPPLTDAERALAEARFARVGVARLHATGSVR